MCHKTFLERMRAHGLYRKSISLMAIKDIQKLRDAPMPLILPAKDSWKSKPSASIYMGPIIAAGLAKLNREAGQYEITDAGLEYLAAVEERVLKLHEQQLN